MAKKTPLLETEKVLATFILEIEYNETPYEQDLQELIDKARELGRVRRATYSQPEPVEKELV